MTELREAITVYPVADGFVVAENGTWLPGYYDSEETARAATDLPDSDLATLSARICHKDAADRAITASDLA